MCVGVDQRGNIDWLLHRHTSIYTRTNPPRRVGVSRNHKTNHPPSHPPHHPKNKQTGGAVGAEKKAAATGKPVPTKAGAAKPAIGKAKATGAASKPMAKGGAAAKGKAAAAEPAPKKKGWF